MANLHSSRPRKLNWDALGITTSLLCAIHCAFLPLLAAALPILNIPLLRRPGFEYGMILSAFLIGLWALGHGFRRHHRRKMPLILFTIGVSALIAKEIWQSCELIFLPVAALLIISAHLLNHRLSHPAPPL